MKLNLKKTLKSKKVWGLIVVLIILVGACMVAFGGKEEPRGMMVTTMPIGQKDIEESITLKAPLGGSESVEIVSKMHYEILQINVKEGDRVSKGQVLAVLDSEALVDEIEAAQDALALSTAQLKERLDNDQVAYEKALDALQTAQVQYERNQTLATMGAISQEALEQEEKAIKEAQRAVDIYKVVDGKVVANDSDKKNLEIARKNLERKQEAFSEAEIKCTIDGTVTRVNTKVGRFADETEDKKPMFVVENLDQLKMKVSVSEYDIAKIAVGQTVEISADVLKGEVVEGVVARISPTGEQKEQSTERVIPIEINVLSKNEKLIAGINANAKIQIAKAEQVLVVPIEGIVENAEGVSQVAKVQSDNTVLWVPVTLGVENDLEVEISGEGIQAGDNIILGVEIGRAHV